MLRSCLFLMAFLFFALFASALAHADAQGQPSKEPDEAKQVERLIEQLGSGDFQEREAASQQLKKIGPPALPALRTAAENHKDAEIQLRATGLVDTIENSLEGLLIEYRSLGLPIPPQDARLVRYVARREKLGDGKIQPKAYSLAFLVKTGNDKEPWVLVNGVYEKQCELDPKPEEVKPDPDALKDLLYGGDLEFAIQCQARGWTKLAENLFERSVKESKLPPRKELVQEAWEYWRLQLTVGGHKYDLGPFLYVMPTPPRADRAIIAKRLNELIRRDKALDTEPNRAMLKSLELALVPSKAKPGSIEALIDGLVDYEASTGMFGTYSPEDQYMRIAELGFDAVPALIEHLDDERITRGMMWGYISNWNNYPSFHLHVRHIVADVLEGLAGQRFGRRYEDGRQKGEGVEKDEAQKWWDEAKKVGEERYLVDNVLAPRLIRGFEPPQVNAAQLRVIQVKYPKHIPTIYRSVLDDHPEYYSGELAKSLSECKLPLKEKMDLLLSAAKHKDYKHRLAALRAMKALDQKQFDAQLIAAIKAFPDDVQGDYLFCPEVQIARLANECDDPEVWQVLEKVAKRAAVGFRMWLLDFELLPRERQRHRVERMQLLAAFLDDSAASTQESNRKHSEPWDHASYDIMQVRDFVAMQLLDEVGIDVESNPKRTPAQWAEIRNKARAALKEKLKPN
jgi:hypothetical protein